MDAANITISISPGELLDRITILEIKLNNIKDKEKLQHIQAEWAMLSAARVVLPATSVLVSLESRLRDVNTHLWHIEDDIREYERRREFGAEFIELARSVYKVNDQRASIKREINTLLDATYREEKSYGSQT